MIKHKYSIINSHNQDELIIYIATGKLRMTTLVIEPGNHPIRIPTVSYVFFQVNLVPVAY